MKLGSTTISKVYLGSTEVTKMALGATEIFNSSPAQPLLDGSVTASSTTPTAGSNVTLTFNATTVNGQLAVDNATPSTGGSITLTWSESLSYQWKKDGVDIDGETSATLTLTGVQEADSATYSVFVTDTRVGTTGTFSTTIAVDVGLGVNVLFFDDFENDIGWNPTPSGVPTTSDVPSRWASRIENSITHSIDTGYGRDGSAGYRLAMTPFASSGIRETGRLTCYFDESTAVHLRMFMKVSEGFRWFQPGETNNLWKQFRFHQSPWVREPGPPFGTNGEDNSGFVVRTLTGGPTAFGYDHTCCWRSDSGVGSNSASGAITMYRYQNSVASYFGDLDADGFMTNTKWAQIDISILLGDIDQDNGVLKVWMDGDLQSTTNIIAFFGGALPITGTGLVTNPRSHYGYPPGFNSFSFFDNYSNLTKGWTEQHYVYVDSVTIFDNTPNDLVG